MKEKIKRAVKAVFRNRKEIGCWIGGVLFIFILSEGLNELDRIERKLGGIDAELSSIDTNTGVTHPALTIT